MKTLINFLKRKITQSIQEEKRILKEWYKEE